MRTIAIILLLQALAAAAPPTTKPAGIAVILSGSTAPCTIHVHALNIPLSTGTPLTARYEWDFADPNSSRNTLEGFNAAHTYDREGKYTITLHLAEESGQSRTFSLSIHVLPDTRRSIYISCAGDDSNRGQSPDHAIRSPSRLRRLLSNETKILFRRGDTFSVSEPIMLSHSGVQLTAYGQGASPLLNWTGPCNSGATMIPCAQTSHDNVIENLTFDTASPANDHVVSIIGAAGTNLSIRNCTFLNVAYAINANSKPHGLLVQNCSSPLDAGLREYFLWLEGSDAVVLDNTVANSVYQHVIRASSYTRVLIAYNHLANLDRRNVEPLDFSKASITMQKGLYLYLASNSVAKGGIGVGPLGNDDGLSDAAARTQWAVVENNTVDEASIELHHGLEHAIVRNNKVTRTDAPAFNIDGYDDRYKRQVLDASILNNTATNSAPTGFFLRLWGKAENLTLVGNRYDAPKLLLDNHDNAAALWTQPGAASSFRVIRDNTFPSKN